MIFIADRGRCHSPVGNLETMKMKCPCGWRGGINPPRTAHEVIIQCRMHVGTDPGAPITIKW